MAPLFKRRPSSASIQPDSTPSSEPSVAPTSTAPSISGSPAPRDPSINGTSSPRHSITWGKKSRRSSIQSLSSNSAAPEPTVMPDQQEGTPVKRKPSFLKRLLHKDSPSRSASGGGLTSSSSTSSLASNGKASPRNSRPPPAASATLSKSTAASAAALTAESPSTTSSPSNYKTWRREREGDKKAGMSALGREEDRDTRGDDDEDAEVESPSTKERVTPVPGTTETENRLNHGETLAPGKLLAIASDPIQDAPTAAAPAGGLHNTSPTSPISPVESRRVGENNHARQVSNGESLWSLGQSDSDSSDDDDVGFETPDEGLSEVGEEEEEDVKDAPAKGYSLDSNVIPSSAAAAVAIPPPTYKEAVHPKSNPIPDVYHPSGVDQNAILDDDLKASHRIMDLFLNSHIAEAEKIVQEGDPKRERLYFQLADAILCTLKGIMTFEPTDLKHAHNVTRYVTELSSHLRRQSSGIGSRLSGFVKGTGGNVAFIKGMSKVEQHAELIYAETLLLKAILGIISGGEWMALVKEALNMRSAEGIYRSLNSFCEAVDKAHPSGFDDSVDRDFRSGIELGVGMSALMLSMMPGKVVRIAEVFGLQGSRPYALSKLAQPGGWKSGVEEPGVSKEQEGIRRPVADMGLMTFHLVISSLMPVTHVDVPMGARILWWNLERYPNGVFTLFFQSRLHVLQCQPHVANKVLDKAMVAQQDYIQLQLLSRWDLGINSLALNHFADAAACFQLLYEGSNWSKATYTYSIAAALLETDDYDQEAVEKYMKEVPKAIRKIVGKSIPIEKFVSRKSRKFLSQGRLAIPGVELAYVYGLLVRTPGWCLQQRTIPRINKLLAELEASTPETYHDGKGYWDDFALAHMLRGVSYALLALPNHGTVISKDDPSQEPFDKSKMAEDALEEFQLVLQNGRKIELDHFLVFYTHYEIGCTLERMGKYEEAIREFELVLHGKPPEVDTSKMTGKYSLHSGVTLKCSAAIQQIKEKQSASK